MVYCNRWVGERWTHILNAVDLFKDLEGAEDDSGVRDDVHVPRAPADDHQAPRDLKVRELVSRHKKQSDNDGNGRSENGNIYFFGAQGNSVSERKY